MIQARPLTFPDNFVWGFAAAAPQIEGAAFEDGKGWSVWDTFARKPGAVKNGHNLDVACDHYHRFEEDVRLMRSLGARHYRLSIAWPRILPQGDGAVNQKGLDFYHRLFDAMDKHGLQPWVTMFHWDLPQELETRFGGWRDRRIADAFAQYADVIVKAFGGRVKRWITLNEVLCFTLLGYHTGSKAPGLKLPIAVTNQAYHNALLCHGHGVRAVREHGGAGALVGITDNSSCPIPVYETDEHIAAARRAFVRENARVLHPVLTGSYSEDYLRESGADAPKVEPGDMAFIGQPTDFLGMNIYTGGFVRAADNPTGYESLSLPNAYPQTDAVWLKIMPQSIYWGPRHAAEVYGVRSVYITENGCGYKDAGPDAKGEVLDLHRRDLVRNYLHELQRSITDGVPIHGYFLWSFMDNYEWEDGYDLRFGVVYCDFATQARTPKLSARYYSQVIAHNALV